MSTTWTCLQRITQKLVWRVTFQSVTGTIYDFDGPRTNNHVEGWHHPNIYKLIEVSQREEAATLVEGYCSSGSDDVEVKVMDN